VGEEEQQQWRSCPTVRQSRHTGQSLVRLLRGASLEPTHYVLCNTGWCCMPSRGAECQCPPSGPDGPWQCGPGAIARVWLSREGPGPPFIRTQQCVRLRPVVCLQLLCVVSSGPLLNEPVVTVQEPVSDRSAGNTCVRTPSAFGQFVSSGTRPGAKLSLESLVIARRG
jgi:hypothetical protein